jgi:protein AIR1/2
MVKKQARIKTKVGKRDVQDFVPQGGRFATAPLDVDPDATSSSGSNSSGSEDESASEEEEPSEVQKSLDVVPAIINWNKGSRSTIRTSLAGKASLSGGDTPSSAFESVNDKYWRSRSASLSQEDAQGRPQTQEDFSKYEQGDGDLGRANQKPRFVDESEGSESGEVSEGGDSIMLNLGPGNDRSGDGMPGSDPFKIDTQPDTALVSTNGHGVEKPRRSKEDAFRVFSKKYKTPPSILADLDRKDLEIQARCFFYNHNIHDIDLQHHISCTECLQEGHLAIVCPTKEVCFSVRSFCFRVMDVRSY